MRPLRNNERVLSNAASERLLAKEAECGMVAGLIRDVPTCRELIDRIMAEAETLIRGRLEGMLSAAA